MTNSILARAALLIGAFSAATALQAATMDVTTTADSGAGSLRQAIADAQNCVGGPHTIKFTIPGAGPHVISLQSSLPSIVCNGTVIDGYTQPGALENTQPIGTNNAVILVQVDGSAAGVSGRAFDIVPAVGVAIRGLSITNWTDLAVHANGCDTCSFEGNYVNVTPDGSSTAGKGVTFVNVINSGIGGSAPAQSNLFAGETGIALNNSATFVQGNQFNVCPCGTLFATNRLAQAVFLNTDNATVTGNLFRGTSIEAIGVPGAFNSIDGNKFEDVASAARLTGFANTFSSNQVLNTSLDGLSVGACCSLIFGNVIQNSGGSAIALGDFSNSTDIDSNVLEGSAGWGISGGGRASWAGNNVIRGNAAGGIVVAFGDMEITTNSIYGNGGPGIDNDGSATPGPGDGPTPNDEAVAPYDQDTGPNDLQNYPVVTSVLHVGTDTVISGTLKTIQPPFFFSPPAGFSKERVFTIGNFIELFSNTAMPTTTQGETPIAVIVLTAASFDPVDTGRVNWSVTVPGLHNFISATVSLDTCGDGCIVTSEFSPAVAAATAVGTLSPASLDFGVQTVGSTSASRTVTFQNTGTAPLVISDIATVGDFGYSGCGFPFTLAPGASCTFEITFSPLSEGAQAGKIRITSNATNSPSDILLAGTGTPADVPGISVSPTAIGFGIVALGSLSRDRITVRNSGTGPLAIGGITVTGPFGVSTDCPAAVEPGRTCLILVTFEAATPGSNSGLVQIVSNASEVPLEIPLSAEVLAAPPANLATLSSVDFGQLVIGTTASQALALQNTGSETLVIAGVSVSGAGFALEGSCVEIAPGASCAITVRFTATGVGVFTGAIVIESNSTGGARNVAVRAEGVRAPTPQLELSVGGLGFGNQGVGSSSAPRIVRLTSVGGAPVTLQGFQAPPEFGIGNGCGATLAPGASCELTVTFQPLAPGTRRGRLVVLSDAQNGPHSVSLTGTGCPFFSIGARRDPSRLCGP